jgi:hypothetical protein
MGLMIEELCRRVCELKGINPDGRGFALSKETEERLGKEYKLWEYQIPFVELVYNTAIEYKTKHR